MASAPPLRPAHGLSAVDAPAAPALTSLDTGALMPRLILCANDGRPSRTIEIEGKVATIGRSSENHIQIDDLNSSRHHCELHEGQDGAWELIDKDSRNGLFVNGHRVARKALEPGDKIEIGTTILYFQHVAAAEPGKETVAIATGVFSTP